MNSVFFPESVYEVIPFCDLVRDISKEFFMPTLKLRGYSGARNFFQHLNFDAELGVTKQDSEIVNGESAYQPDIVFDQLLKVSGVNRHRANSLQLFGRQVHFRPRRSY